MAPNNSTKPNVIPLRSAWSSNINAAWRKGLNSVLETGALLLRAKAELPHGEFEKMVGAELEFDPSTAQRLMAIAKHPVLSKAAHVQLLPASWGTLYELTKLPPEVVEAKIEEGVITPKIERKEVIALRPPAPPKQKKKKRRPAATREHIAQTEHERDLGYLRSVWAACCQSAREAFLQEIGIQQ